MAVEFREIRRGEVAEALAFAAGLGLSVEAAELEPQLSLIALGRDRVTLGTALHSRDAAGRRCIAVQLAESAPPGLARLLIDRALRKAEARGTTTTHIRICGRDIEQQTWSGADLLTRLQATVGPRQVA